MKKLKVPVPPPYPPARSVYGSDRAPLPNYNVPYPKPVLQQNQVEKIGAAFDRYWFFMIGVCFGIAIMSALFMVSGQ